MRGQNHRLNRGAALVLACSAATFASVATAEQTPNALHEGVGQRLEQRTSMPLLKGDVWQRMNEDEKVAFLWGCAHVIAIERELAGRFPKLDQPDFSKKVAEGMPKIGMREVASKVDQFYSSNPTQIETPVLAVIWQSLIQPNLTVGIAGQPVK